MQSTELEKEKRRQVGEVKASLSLELMPAEAFNKIHAMFPGERLKAVDDAGPNIPEPITSKEMVSDVFTGVPKDIIEENDTRIASYALKPSVGTWLIPLQMLHEEDASHSGAANSNTVEQQAV